MGEGQPRLLRRARCERACVGVRGAAPRPGWLPSRPPERLVTCGLLPLAAGSSSLLFPSMRAFMSPAELARKRPEVTISFSSIEGYRDICGARVRSRRGGLLPLPRWHPM